MISEDLRLKKHFILFFIFFDQHTSSCLAASPVSKMSSKWKSCLIAVIRNLMAVDFVQIANMAQVLYLRKRKKENYQKPPRLFLLAGEDVVHESLADASVFKASNTSLQTSVIFSSCFLFFFSLHLQCRRRVDLLTYCASRPV